MAMFMTHLLGVCMMLAFNGRIVFGSHPKIVVMRFDIVEPNSAKVLKSVAVRTNETQVQVSLGEADLFDANNINIKIYTEGFDKRYGDQIAIGAYKDGASSASSSDTDGEPFCAWGCTADKINVHKWDYKTHVFDFRKYLVEEFVRPNNQSFVSPLFLLKSTVVREAETSSDSGAAGIAVGVTLGAVALLLIALAVVFFLRRRRSAEANGASIDVMALSSIPGSPSGKVEHLSVTETGMDNHESGVGGFLTPPSRSGTLSPELNHYDDSLGALAASRTPVNYDHGYGDLPESVTITPRTPGGYDSGHTNISRDSGYGIMPEPSVDNGYTDIATAASPGYLASISQDPGYGAMPEPSNAPLPSHDERNIIEGGGHTVSDDDGYGAMPTQQV